MNIKRFKISTYIEIMVKEFNMDFYVLHVSDTDKTYW